MTDLHGRAAVLPGLALCVGAYLAGGIPLGWLIVRRRRPGTDLRDLGTGNIGASNIYRNVDQGMAALVGPAQFLQGLIPVLAAWAAGLDPGWRMAVALSAVVGNGWPPYLAFRGGRCIAVASGAVAALSPPAFAALLAWYAAGAATRRIAPGVLAGFLTLPVLAAWRGGPVEQAGYTALLALILVRRLDGVAEDLRGGERPAPTLWGRLIWDRRPGRPLVGRQQPRRKTPGAGGSPGGPAQG